MMVNNNNNDVTSLSTIGNESWSTISNILNRTNNESNFNHSSGFLNTNDNYWTAPILIHVISKPIIIVLGTIGNCLAFVVMQKGTLRNISTCFYMAIVALMDTGKCTHFT